jgi:hypothetical protein
LSLSRSRISGAPLRASHPGDDEERPANALALHRIRDTRYASAFPSHGFFASAYG